MADGAPADRAPSLVHPVAPDQSHLDAATATFRMLSDPTRLHILWLLAQTEADVSALTEACGASRTAVSQHLAKLRFTGLVATRARAGGSSTAFATVIWRGWSGRASTTPTTW